MGIVRNIWVGVICGVAAATLGCSHAATATDNTVSFVRGDLTTTVSNSPQKVADATLAAAQDLSLPVDAHAADGLGGHVSMHSSDGTKIEVTLRAEGFTQCKVIIRVGTFGDKELQQRIFDQINRHLSGATPSTNPLAAQPFTINPPPPATAPAVKLPTNPLDVPPAMLVPPPPPPSTAQSN